MTGPGFPAGMMYFLLVQRGIPQCEILARAEARSEVAATITCTLGVISARSFAVNVVMLDRNTGA